MFLAIPAKCNFIQNDERRHLLSKEHREPGLTDWNATLCVFRVTQNKNKVLFHLGPIAL